MADINKALNIPGEKPSYLTLEEINRLINSPADKKIDIAKKIAKSYKQGDAEEGEIRIAEQVFRTLLKDTEVKVRKSLSESIKNVEGIPYDVVISLARDIEEVSLPVLQFSEVLTDVDLVDIIASAENEQQHLAISKRNKIPEKVSEALIETKNEAVVGSLMQNKNAEVSDVSYRKVVENHSDSEVVLGSMIERGSLSINLVERLTGTISNELYKRLSKKHKGSMEKLEEAVKKSRDVATMQVMGLKSTEEEFHEFMVLMGKLKMTEELIPVSALCMANLNLFEVSVAKRTRVPVLNIRELIKDGSNNGFRALYSRAELPMHLYDSACMLIEVIRESKGNFANHHILRLSSEAANRFIEQLMLKVEEKGKPENFEYILSLIKHTAEGGSK